MNKFFKLLQFTISYYIKPRFKDKKERNKYIGLAILLCLCFIVPVCIMIAYLYLTAEITIQNNALPEFMSIIFFAAQISVLFVGTTTYINVMYFSNDNSLLASLPIKSSYIYLSKLIVTLISMIFIASLMIIPAIIVIAIAAYKNNFIIGLNYYLCGLLGIIIIPLIPILIVSIFSFPLMKIISFLKKKPILMSILTVIFTIALMLLIYIPIFKFEININSENNQIIPLNVILLIKKIGKYAYPTYLLSNAMLGINTLKNITILILITITCLFLSILLSSLLYKNIISNLNEGGISKNNSKEKTNHVLNSSRTLLVREIKSITRDSQLFIQTLMMVLLAPILIIIFLTLIIQDTNVNDESISNSIYIIKFGSTFFYINFIMGMNYLSTIAISREGKELSILQSLPISPKKIIKTKLLFADIVSTIGCFISSLSFFITSKTPWYYTIFLFIGTSLLTISINSYGLMRDISNPNLNWINIKDITKNNARVLLPFIISSIPGILVMIFSFIIPMTISSNIVAIISMIGIIVLIDFIYYILLRFKKLDKMIELFNKIEA